MTRLRPATAVPQADPVADRGVQTQERQVRTVVMVQSSARLPYGE